VSIPQSDASLTAVPAMDQFDPSSSGQGAYDTPLGITNPPIDELLDRVSSKYALVIYAAKRARQINDYYNQLGEGLGKIVPPQVTSVSRKPLSIAMEEIEVGKIESVPLPTEEELAAAAQAEADAAAAREALADTPDETA
jgi:DNA-directed RNA polymerase subunit omega